MNDNKRKTVTAKEMTKAIIWGTALIAILLIFIYMNIYGSEELEYGDDNMYAMAHKWFYTSIIGSIVEAILMGILLFLPSLMFGTISAFSKKIITYDSLDTVMRNLIIFTVIICVIQGIYVYIDINDNVTELNEELEETEENEELLEYLYSEANIISSNGIDNLESSKEAVEEKIDNWNLHCVILEISLIIIYFTILLLEKRLILKFMDKADEDNRKTSILSR